VTADLVIAIGFMVLIGLIIIGGVWAAFHFGGEDEKADQARRDARNATKQIKRRNEPLLDDKFFGDRLRRQAERLARLFDRAPRG